MFNNQYPGGYNYVAQQAPQPVKWTSPLTEEDKKFLQQNTPAFTLTPSKEEMVRAKCAHRDPVKRQFTIVPTSNGTVTCTLCGEEFNVIELAKDEVEQHVNATLDLLNTTKMAYLDMAPEAIVGYYQFLPFLKKLPQLYDIAIGTMTKAGAANAFNSIGQPNMYAGPSFNNLNMAIGGYGQQQVPPHAPMQTQYQQQMQPMQQGYEQNPFHQSMVPQQGHVMPNYGYAPQQPMQPVQPGAVVPTVPAPPQEPVSMDNVTVNKQMEV